MSRPSATPFTIRRRLAGLSNKDVGELLNLTPDRAGELLGERAGAIGELSELRCELRTALNKGPDLRVVYRDLHAGLFCEGSAGRVVRWTRIVLDYTLREWSSEFGLAISWWSRFERDEVRAWAGIQRGVISRPRLVMIGMKTHEAALRLAELFPSATLPLTKGGMSK